MFKVKYDEERYHATTQNGVYPDMSNVNKKYYSGGETYQPTHVVVSDGVRILFHFNKGKGLLQQAEVAQGVPGRLRPRIFLTFGTTRVVGRQPYTPATFAPGEIPGIHF